METRIKFYMAVEVALTRDTGLGMKSSQRIKHKNL